MEKIKKSIIENKYITIKELEKITGLKRRGVEYNIKILKEKGIIKRIGGDKGGYWEIV